jgi:hypothetical protein
MTKRRTFIGVVRDGEPDWVPDSRERPLLSEALVERYREQFEAGKGAALLNAVDLCARSGLPLPLWARQAFCDRFLAWASYRAPTLDVAFDVVRPKRAKLGTLARREAQRACVVREVVDQHQAGAPLDERLFAQAGKALNLSGGAVKSIYYEDASRSLRKIFESERGRKVLSKPPNK